MVLMRLLKSFNLKHGEICLVLLIIFVAENSHVSTRHAVGSRRISVTFLGFPRPSPTPSTTLQSSTHYITHRSSDMMKVRKLSGVDKIVNNGCN